MCTMDSSTAGSNLLLNAPYDYAQEEQNKHWRFTDFDHAPEISRDGSVHATDEVINAASHMAAAMFSFMGTVLLVVDASARGEPWKIVSFSIYGISLLFMFVASTLHHSITGPPKIEERLRMVDYFAIYPLIAGTFTPLCLVFFHDGYIGWSFFGCIWVLAIAGMLMTVFLFQKIPKWMSMTIYISMGWIGAFMTYWLYPFIGFSGIFLLTLGGVFFTAGGYVYSTEEPNPVPGRFGFHEIWHIAVILGVASHWCLMFFYVLPWEPPA